MSRYGKSFERRVHPVLVSIALLISARSLVATELIFEPFGLQSAISQNYGDRVTRRQENGFRYDMDAGPTPNVLVDYGTQRGNNQATAFTRGYGNLVNVMYGANGFQAFEMTLSADPGYRVVLHGFDMGGWAGSQRIQSVQVVDEDGERLFRDRNALIDGTRHTSFDFIEPLQGNTLSLQVDGRNLNGAADRVALDNILFSQERDFPSAFTPIDPRSTYLMVDRNDEDAVDAPGLPLDVLLGDIAIRPGDVIKVQRFGEFDVGNTPEATNRGQVSRQMTGVFSSSRSLVTGESKHLVRNRVVDALKITAGDFDLHQSGPTYPLARATDIAHDFVIDAGNDDLFNPHGAVVRVPEGATHLFVSAGDNQWYDNSLTEMGGYGVKITRLPNLVPGDADEDLDFDGFDLVKVQLANKYRSGLAATWGEGDWDAGVGGAAGFAPEGDGVFDQKDIVAALAAGAYRTGSYAAVGVESSKPSGAVTVAYDSATGEVRLDVPADIELTSIRLESASGVFAPNAAQNLDGSFDANTESTIFKATFGGGFGSLSFGSVAPPRLTEDFLLDDLEIVATLSGGGQVGEVSLVHVPEPGGLILALCALFGVCMTMRQQGIKT